MTTGTTSHLTVARAYLDCLSSPRGLDVFELLVDDCKVRDSLFGESNEHEQVRAHVCEMQASFPDLAYTIDEVLADAGDQLALRWSASGTHRGPLMGIPATQRAISISGILLLRFAKTQLSAITSLWEPLSMLQQLALVPEPVPGSEPSPNACCVEALAKECMPAQVDVDAAWDT
jgi:steroid delta-isomerase-like uncharacterized protein